MSDQRRRVIASCIAATVVASCLVGCSSSGGDFDPGPVPDVFTERPFSQLWIEQQENARAIHDGIGKAASECMKEKGFTYTQMPFKAETFEPTRIGDVAYAEKHGFFIVDGAREPKTGPPEPEKVEGQDEGALLEALIGKPIPPEVGHQEPDVVEVSFSRSTIRSRKSSCMGKARGLIAGDLKTYLTMSNQVQELSNNVITAIEEDRKWKENDSSWRSCMAESGFAVKSKLEARSDFSDKVYKADPRQWDSLREAEVAMAVASAKCEVKLGSRALYYTLMKKHEKAMLDKNQGFLVQWAEYNTQAAQRAKDYLKK